MFDQQKKTTLNKADCSKKGNVDEQIVPLLDKLNSNKDFYTTSSCAGRIVVLKQPDSGKKKDYDWLYVTHELADYNSIKNSIESDSILWLRMEPFIIHIVARNMEKADWLLKKCRLLGLKHSGILSIGKRIIIEIVGNERMDCPISAVPDDFLKILVNEANNKLQVNRDKLKKLQDGL